MLSFLLFVGAKADQNESQPKAKESIESTLKQIKELSKVDPDSAVVYLTQELKKLRTETDSRKITYLREGSANILDSVLHDCSCKTKTWLYTRLALRTQDELRGLKSFYYGKAIDIADKEGCIDTYNKSLQTLLKNYGTSLNGNGDYEAAISVLQRAQSIESGNEAMLAKVHLELGRAFTYSKRSGTSSRGIKVLQQGLKLDCIVDTKIRIAQTIANGWLIHDSASNPDSSLVWLDFADRLSELHGKKDFKSNSEWIRGIAQKQRGEIKQALLTLHSLDPGDRWNILRQVASCYSNVSQDSVYKYLVKGLNLISDTSWDEFNVRFLTSEPMHKTSTFWYLNDLAQLETMRNPPGAQQYYRLAFDCLDNLRSSHVSKESVQFRGDAEQTLFSHAIHNSYNCFQLTGDTNFILDALEFSERAKAFSLKLITRNQSDPGILASRDRIDLIQEALKDDSIDDTMSEFYRQRIGELSVREFVFEYDIKASLKKLASEETSLLSYYQISDTLFTISYDTQLKISKSIIAPTAISEFKRRIYDSSPTADWLEETRDLNKKIFSALLPNAQFENLRKRVLIIPDGEVFGTPFEAIRIDDQNKYLLEDHSISYSFTIPMGIKEASGNLISATLITPWENSPFTTIPKLSSTKNEQKVIQDISGKGNFTRIGTTSKESFTGEIGKPDLLSIITHGTVVDGKPVLTMLTDEGEIDSIAGSSIRGLSNVPQLTIINACFSGQGVIEATEGIQNLAYDFLYAGGKTVLVGNTSLPNGISNDILTAALSNWKRGSNLSEALQEGKLEYLAQQSDPRFLHPSAWAGLTIYGTTTPVEINQSGNINYWIFTLIALLLLGGVVLKKARAV